MKNFMRPIRPIKNPGSKKNLSLWYKKNVKGFFISIYNRNIAILKYEKWEQQTYRYIQKNKL
jgi:hypothetical protein